MLLNYIWVGFFLVGFIIAIVRTCIGYFISHNPADMHVFSTIGLGTFDSAKMAFNVALGLGGVITLWMGIMKVGEKAGAINFIGKIIGPFFRRLFPEIPEGHPAQGQIMMNFSANMLGLSNAATPMGLKAMESMQELNPDKETASNPMIMFLAINTAGFTLIPVTIMGIRAANGAANPTDVFIPILIASFCASFIGMIAVSIRQRINLFERVLFTWLISALAIFSLLIYGFMQLSPLAKEEISTVGGGFFILLIVCAFVIAALIKKINVFEAFIEGAKDGFATVIRIVPYLVAMIVAIGVFRNSGALNYIVEAFTLFFEFLGVDTRFVPALPTAFMKPLSGGGTEGLAIDAIKTYGVDSFAGRLASVIYASADTTFYIVALYFGAVKIKNTRYAIGAGLIADFGGIVAAILVSYLFWG
ncbi:MAG: nucleoside recognition domain-containing protein [Bacteroidia bacterium]